MICISIRSARTVLLDRVLRLALAGWTLIAGAQAFADDTAGPWYGFASLPATNVLPADVGSDGIPDWPWLDHWRVGETVLVAEAGAGFVYLQGLHPETPDRKTKVPPLTTGAVLTAETTLESSVARELDFGAGVDGRMTVWINGEQVAAGPATVEAESEEAMLRFRARVRHGTNPIRVRCEPNGPRAKFWLRVCARAGSAAGSRAVGGPRRFGYRGDGTGRYPDADPVTAWDIEKNINVLWRTKLLWAKAQPVIAGDRVFVTEEPQLLTCLDKHTGKVLWRREADVFEFTNSGARAEAASLREAALNTLDTKAHRDWVERVRTAGGCVMPLAYKDDGGPNGPWTGFAFGTPVTDGEHIWVRYFTGVIACYDMEGNRRWAVRHPPVQSSGSECTSPVLVDGKLVIQFLYEQPHRLWMRMDRVWLLALDAATGKEAWRSDALDFRPNSTPGVMRLRRGDRSLTVLVTGSGTVLRSDDGKVLVPRLPGNDGWSSPTIADDVVYRFAAGPCTAIRLILVDRDHVGAQRLWMRASGEEFAGGAVHDNGFLYALEGAEHCKGYRVFDAATGRRIDPRANRDVEFAGVLRWQAVWTPQTLAGGLVYFVSRGSSSWREAGTGSYVSVMQADPEGRFLAHNRVDGHLDTPPVFEGGRVYLRTENGLTCLARVGEEGMRYEAAINASNLYADLPDTPPRRCDAVRIEPAATNACEAVPLVYGRLKLFDAPWRDGQPIPKSERTNLAVYAEQTYLLNAANLPCLSNGVAETQVVLRNDRAGTVRILLPGDHVSARLNDVPVDDGARVALSKGAYRLNVRVDVCGRKTVPTYVRFEPSDDLEEETRAWQAARDRCRVTMDRHREPGRRR